MLEHVVSRGVVASAPCRARHRAGISVIAPCAGSRGELQHADVRLFCRVELLRRMSSGKSYRPLAEYVERLGQSRAWGFPAPEAEPQDPLALSAKLRAAQRLWLVRNRSPLSAAELPVAKSHRLVWQRELEPHDEDDRSLFANSHGRLISLQLYAAEP